MPRTGTTVRGRATRARIVDSATTLFQEHGYLDTTMAAIAHDAGVSVQTLYLAFGSKAEILRAAHDRAVVGDDEPVAVLERPWVDDVRSEPDGARALAMVVENCLDIIERVYPIASVIAAGAADAEVAALQATINAQRHESLSSLARELAHKTGFAGESTWAADVLYTVLSVELYRLLVIERSWSIADWRRWAYDSVALRLFPARRQARTRAS